MIGDPSTIYSWLEKQKLGYRWSFIDNKKGIFTQYLRKEMRDKDARVEDDTYTYFDTEYPMPEWVGEFLGRLCYLVGQRHREVYDRYEDKDLVPGVEFILNTTDCLEVLEELINDGTVS